MGFFTSFNKLLCKIEEFILSYGIIVMSVILIGNVISRSVFNNSWKFAEEVGQCLLFFVTFVGVSYATRKGKHIRMSAIFDAVSDKSKKVLMIIVSGITSVTMFYIAYLGLQYTLKVHRIGRVTPALRFPMFVIVGVVALGFFLSGIQYFLNLVLNLKEKEVYVGTEKPIGDYSDIDTNCELSAQCLENTNSTDCELGKRGGN